jgi:hypothetical protein
MTEDGMPEDPSWLRDRDWVEVNKLRHAFKGGGGKALAKAWNDLLDKDALQFSRVMCAYFPDRARHIEDAIEERGYTLQELTELAKKRRH